MTYRAKYVREIAVVDPDTGGVVHMTIYKHENGGMFAIDSSFVEQVLDDRGVEGSDDLIMCDPFGDLEYPNELYLED